jgi:pimeloyl-ACP methyl ester carboxylesterase
LTVTHAETGQDVALSFGRQGLLFILMLDLGDPADFILFPRMIHELERGETETVTWFVQKRYRQMAQWPALLFINRGASGATAERWATIRAQAKDSPFGLVRCNFSPEIDAAFGINDLGDEFRKPVRSRVPTLFVSGSLDANTPPERAERARRGFSRSRHLIVENGGHDLILSHPDVHVAIRAFFAGEDIEGLEIKLPVPRFAVLAGDDDLVNHRALQ